MINADSSNFAGHLMRSEAGSVELRRRYELGKLALQERRLNPAQRRLGWASLPIFGGLALGVGYRLLTGDAALPAGWIALEAACALGTLGFGIWMTRVLLGGGRVTRRDDRAMEWIGGVGLIAVTLAFYEVASSLDDARAALRLHGVATVLLVGGVYGILHDRIRRAGMEARVEVLELALRLDALARSVAAPPPEGPPADQPTQPAPG